MKKSITIIFILFIFSSVKAQKLEIGSVSIDELQENFHPKDTAAVAAILFKKGRTYFDYNQQDGFVMMTEVSTRIKIYKKEGYDYANTGVAFYIGNSPAESVTFSKAITYNLVNGAIEKTKLKSEGEFTEKKNKFFNIKKITMPNVKIGSIIEYVYTIRSVYYTTFPDWDFQTEIPVNFSEYSTTIPEYYTYQIHRKGFLFPTETVEQFNKSVNLTFKEMTPMQGYSRDNATVNYIATKTTFTLKDIPALRDEAFVNNIDNYSCGLKHELSSTKTPNTLYKLYASSWESVVKSISESDNFGLELSKNNYFDDDIKTITTGLTTDDEKAITIFRYVQNRMNWDGYLGYSCNDGVKKAYATKTGNIAEINLMLVAMLRAAGLKANPVLASTRSNGIPFFPTRTGFNYVFAAIEKNDGFILLDASNKNTNPNILPERVLNWVGKLIRNDMSAADIDLMPNSASVRNITMITTLTADGALKGKIREQNFDYNALVFREKYRNLAQESYLEILEKKRNNIEISNYSIENKAELSKPIVETYEFEKTASADIVGGKVYFSPLFFFGLESNPFKQEKREFPIEYGFGTQTKLALTINIPEGFKVESLPANVAYGLSDGLGSFKYTLANQETSIQVLVTVDINTPIFSADFYADLKAFYAEIIKKENEKIVLIKI